MTRDRGVERFLAATEGFESAVKQMSESTHTAAEAAAAVGAPVGAIVKSLVFTAGGEALIVLVSGPNRVNVEGLGQRLGVVLEKADADFVKAATGYSIGGVPPFGHANLLRTVMDQDFFEFETVWAAAGSPRAVFPLSPEKLLELSHATVMDVT